MSRGYMLRSKRDDWRTPPEVIEVVRAGLGGTIDLDPCGNRYSLVGAEKQYLLSRGEDGLRLPWRGRVFVNPPFSSSKEWIAKAAREMFGGDLGLGPGHFADRQGHYECVLLMPARTDTKAFHEYAYCASALAFWKGRITFVGGKASAPFPVVFLYFGANAKRFSHAFRNHALVLLT